MEAFITIVVGFVAYIIGVFGFSQLIGSIKFWYVTPHLFLTIGVWTVILGLVAAIAYWLLPAHMTGFYIGYAVAFVASFSVKPD